MDYNRKAIKYFRNYLELIFAKDELWEPFQRYVRELEPRREENFFGYHRAPECIDTWKAMLENMGGGWPLILWASAGFLLLQYEQNGHDLDAEMEELTGHRPFSVASAEGEPPFDFSSIDKAVITTDTVSYGPCPTPDKVVQQRLTISRSGQIWLTEYAYGDGVPYQKTGTKKTSIGKADATAVLDYISDAYWDLVEQDLVTDVGTWDLTLWDRHGNKRDLRGSVGETIVNGDKDISAAIRRLLGMDEPFLFDGGRAGDTE